VFHDRDDIPANGFLDEIRGIDWCIEVDGAFTTVPWVDYWVGVSVDCGVKSLKEDVIGPAD